MLGVKQLSMSIDSFQRMNDSLASSLSRQVSAYFRYSDIADSTWKNTPVPAGKHKSFNEIIPDSAKTIVYEKALETINNIKGSLQSTGSDFKARNDEIRYRKMEWHRKFSFSMACLVLFFIGAPLGSIIRKGGIGMPLIAAIVFFLIFHVLNLFGEKFVKEDIANAFTGMWLAVMILIPIGIFLTYKAMRDSQLFNKEFYNLVVNRVRSLFKKSDKV
jgi:lipopolysaccharide export system permease protein